MHINISRINSIVTDDESGTDSVASSRRESKLNHHSIRGSSQWNDDKLKPRRLSTASTAKSSLSVGYRYLKSILRLFMYENFIF
jgi:hypothetical protein